jgi:hypothetical protein
MMSWTVMLLLLLLLLPVLTSPPLLLLLLLFHADVVVFLSRNLEYCSYGHTALFLTDDFDELEQKYNQVGMFGC